ncbi:hypothetical protein AN964_22850 [Heyndrickxia shackletonii]|uniref:N-acetyltransferase domain-containing protein n=2 Tax=Heyndrickxia shackletonii TaxID=157838 RepID=A0A0Q3WRH3_9BACI|nr:GNAT family N-acetyltransferase [Heyndrickxia shackletonii]KQL50499.1 hypothetical protein AN964_22850 [Heyndrickxia shackletonii]
MIIRQMEPQELPVVAKIYVDSMKATHKGIVSEKFMESISNESTVERFKEILENSNLQSFCYVAVKQDKIIGFSMGSLPDHAPQGYQGELNTLYISPHYQRSGVGKKLLHAVTNHFKQNEIRSMFLGVFKDNSSARKFYESVGGIKIGEFLDERLSKINGHDLVIAFYGWRSI